MAMGASSSSPHVNARPNIRFPNSGSVPAIHLHNTKRAPNTVRAAVFGDPARVQAAMASKPRRGRLKNAMDSNL
jgi:hypothetical protein